MKNRKKYSHFGVETKIILLIAFSIGEIFSINFEQDCARKTTQHEYTFDTLKDFEKVFLPRKTLLRSNKVENSLFAVGQVLYQNMAT